MLNWLYLTLNRYSSSSAARLARSARLAPGWLVRRVAAAKLVRTLRHVWRNSPHQRERWREAGIRLRHLRSPRVLERVPFLEPDELTQHPERFFCVPKSDFTHIMSTSGTGGRPRRVWFTTDDIDHQAHVLGATLRRLPGASCVLVLMAAIEPTWGPGDMAMRGVEKAGMRGFQVPRGESPQKHIEHIREFRPDVLISTPTWTHRLTLEADVQVKTLGIKYILLSSQPMPRMLRGKLEAAWGATVIDAYATNECACGIAAECEHGDGLHVAEADFWIEIVDPETGRTLDEGDEGEIVITTLSRRGMPLVRYRIGDLSRFLPEDKPCACGLPLRKIAPIKGRVDHVLIIGSGFNVYPDEFDRAILAVPGVTDYQLTVEKEGYKDRFHVTVETAESVDGLSDRLREALLGIKYIHLNAQERSHVVFGEFKSVAPGTLSAGRRKTVRIVDKRV